MVRKIHDLRNTIRTNRKPKDNVLPKHIWVDISFEELLAGKTNNTLFTYDHIKNNIL
jgi:hypothetical protein